MEIPVRHKFISFIIYVPTHSSCFLFSVTGWMDAWFSSFTVPSANSLFGLFSFTVAVGSYKTFRCGCVCVMSDGWKSLLNPIDMAFLKPDRAETVARKKSSGFLNLKYLLRKSLVCRHYLKTFHRTG